MRLWARIRAGRAASAAKRGEVNIAHSERQLAIAMIAGWEIENDGLRERGMRNAR